MATEIIFGDGKSLEIEDEPANLAKLLSSNKQGSSPMFAGDYLHLLTADEEDVWVNPAEVAYLKRT